MHDLLASKAPFLRALFQRYSCAGEGSEHTTTRRGSGVTSSSAAAPPTAARSTAQQHSGGTEMAAGAARASARLVTEAAWVRLCKELCLCPKPITQLEVMACAHQAKPVTWRGRDAKHPEPLMYTGERSADPGGVRVVCLKWGGGGDSQMRR